MPVGTAFCGAWHYPGFRHADRRRSPESPDFLPRRFAAHNRLWLRCKSPPVRPATPSALCARPAAEDGSGTVPAPVVRRWIIGYVAAAGYAQHRPVRWIPGHVIETVAGGIYARCPQSSLRCRTRRAMAGPTALHRRPVGRSRFRHDRRTATGKRINVIVTVVVS